MIPLIQTYVRLCKCQPVFCWYTSDVHVRGCKYRIDAITSSFVNSLALLRNRTLATWSRYPYKYQVPYPRFETILYARAWKRQAKIIHQVRFSCNYRYWIDTIKQCHPHILRTFSGTTVIWRYCWFQYLVTCPQDAALLNSCIYNIQDDRFSSSLSRPKKTIS